MNQTARKKLEAALATYLRNNFTGVGQRLEGFTIYEGFTVGERTDPSHLVIQAGPEGGDLAYAGLYDIRIDFRIYHLAQLEHPTLVDDHGDVVEVLNYVFRVENNAVIKAALEAIDLTLLVTGYWPEPARRDESTDEDFDTILTLAFNVCHKPDP